MSNCPDCAGCLACGGDLVEVPQGLLCLDCNARYHLCTDELRKRLDREARDNPSSFEYTNYNDPSIPYVWDREEC